MTTTWRRLQNIEDDELIRLILTELVEKLPLERLADMVATRLAAAPPNVLTTAPNGAIAGPLSETSDESQAILRSLPLAHKRKWAFLFFDWGCLRCHRTENQGAGHDSNGLCRECYPLVARWLRESIKKRVADDATITAEEAILRHRRRPLTEGDLDQLTPDTIMEPWFLDKQTETAISQLVPISKQRKWIYFFLDHGCLRCGRTDRKHHCLGFCKRCYLWVSYHLGSSVNRHLVQGRPTPEDLTAKLTLRATTVQRVFAGEDVLPMPTEADRAPDLTSEFNLWKKKLGRGCARMIDALTYQGELSTREIASITGLKERTVQDNLGVLRRNTLVDSHNGRHVLRTPCESCRQQRQVLFQGRRKSKHHAGKYLVAAPASENDG